MEQTISLEPNQEIKEFSGGIDFTKGDASALIPLLQAAQEAYGYLPEHAIYFISDLVDLPTADIYGVITFYAQFRLKPLGKNLVRVCEGTACHVNGAKRILSSLEEELGVCVDETTDDGIFTLQSVACLGCCCLAPAMVVNDETYGNLTPNAIRKILKKYKLANINKN